VLGDVGSGDLDLPALARAAAAQRLQRGVDALGLERRLVPLLGDRLARTDQAGCGCERKHAGAASEVEEFSAIDIHGPAILPRRQIPRTEYRRPCRRTCPRASSPTCPRPR